MEYLSNLCHIVMKALEESIIATDFKWHLTIPSSNCVFHEVVKIIDKKEDKKEKEPEPEFEYLRMG
jgi:hypothetical protein